MTSSSDLPVNEKRPLVLDPLTVNLRDGFVEVRIWKSLTCPDKGPRYTCSVSYGDNMGKDVDSSPVPVISNGPHTLPVTSTWYQYRWPHRMYVCTPGKNILCYSSHPSFSPTRYPFPIRGRGYDNIRPYLVVRQFLRCKLEPERNGWVKTVPSFHLI